MVHFISPFPDFSLSGKQSLSGISSTLFGGKKDGHDFEASRDDRQRTGWRGRTDPPSSPSARIGQTPSPGSTRQEGPYGLVGPLHETAPSSILGAVPFLNLTRGNVSPIILCMSNGRIEGATWNFFFFETQKRGTCVVA